MNAISFGILIFRLQSNENQVKLLAEHGFKETARDGP